MKIRKILFFYWEVFNQDYIKDSFERKGLEIVCLRGRGEKSIDIDEDFFYEQILESKPDAAFSVNYFANISWACNRAGIPYISWTVDSPMLTMYDKSIYNSCNKLFIFDRIMLELLDLELGLSQKGACQMFYLPLASDPFAMDKILANRTESELESWGDDISFVGGLYYKNSYDGLKDRLPAYLKGYFDGAFAAQLDIYGDNFFDSLLTSDIIAELEELIDFRQDEKSLSNLALVFKNTFLGYKMAQFERIKSLNRLARTMSTSLYSDCDDERLENVHFRGSVDYKSQMPLVFAASKINLNMTIRNIRTGLPLRVWDVLAAGGFLLTNFQAELPAYFENGKELAYYSSQDELEELATYYLTHDSQREAIARAGQLKVRKYHSYDARIEQILAFI